MKLFAEHHGFWTERNKKSLYLGLALVLLSLFIQIRAGHYSAHTAASAHFVGDIFLDNLPVVDLDFMIVTAALALWIFSVSLLAVKPRELLFGLKALALYTIFRAFFLSLTHVGIYPRQITFDDSFGYNFYKLVTFQGNYFFSGHTGFPFLMMLIFWEDKLLRYFFLAMSIIFGATVLLAHVHYSIDVFAAPFIVYGIYRIAQMVFKEDYKILNSHS